MCKYHKALRYVLIMRQIRQSYMELVYQYIHL